MHEPITETRTVYHCPWCGKPYLRKQDVNYHINMKCRKNPAHVHPCFWCEHLEKEEREITVFIGGPWGESEEKRTVPSFHCKKHNDWMYSALSCKHGHPCAEDGDHIPMPTECKDFINHDYKGNPVPWNLETFIGKSWQQKKRGGKEKMNYNQNNQNTQNTEQNCLSCMFYCPNISSCQRMPPTVQVFVTDDGKEVVKSYFPRVNASWCWCGEYKPIRNKN